MGRHSNSVFGGQKDLRFKLSRNGVIDPIICINKCLPIHDQFHENIQIYNQLKLKCQHCYSVTEAQHCSSGDNGIVVPFVYVLLTDKIYSVVLL